MKKLTSFLLLILFATACSRAASSAEPTQPAVNFPTIAPGSIPACAPADLETSSNSNGSPESITLGVTLTNRTKNFCTLANPPQASLLDAEGKALMLQTREIIAVQTPPAPDLIQLAPNQAVILTMIWQNYCQPTKTNDVTVRLTLGQDQFLDVKMKPQTLPECKAETDPSIISVAPYSVPP